MPVVPLVPVAPILPFALVLATIGPQQPMIAGLERSGHTINARWIVGAVAPAEPATEPRPPTSAPTASTASTITIDRRIVH
jgi:hypothetical protein